MAESLFDKLNLDEREIRAFMQIPESRVKMVLRELRRFYSAIYLDSGIDDQALHDVNNSIDRMTDNPGLFMSEARKYLDNKSRQPTSVTDRLRHYQNRVKESGERAKALEERLKESGNRVKPLEIALEDTTESLSMFRHLALGYHPTTEGKVYLPDMQDFTYLLETKSKTQILFAIDENYILRKSGIREGYQRGDYGKFAGGISLENLPSQMVQTNSQSQSVELIVDMVAQYDPREKRLYHALGRKLQPYLEEGMWVVTGTYLTQQKGKPHLALYAEVLKIKPK